MDIKKRNYADPLTSDLLLNRKKHEQNIVIKGEEVDMPLQPIDTSEEVLQVNGEHVELETFMNRGNSENINKPKELYMKLDITMNNAAKHDTSSFATNRIEDHEIVEKCDKSQLQALHIKMDEEGLSYKNDNDKLEIIMEEENFEDWDTKDLQFAAELDIKVEGDVNLDSTSDLVLNSDGSKEIQAEGYQVVYGSSGRDSFSCYNCKYTADRKNWLINHMKLHESRIKVYSCYHCAYKTCEKKLFDSHMRMYLSNKSIGVTNKLYVCTECNYKIDSRGDFGEHLLTHFKSHYGSMLKTCLYCNATYKDKRVLDEHILRLHPEHIASVTSKIHKCIECSYKTTNTGKLAHHSLKHIDIASRPKPKLSICIHCDAAFVCKRSLEDHVLKNHPNFVASLNRKIYECTECSYKTSINQKLQKHLSSHPGVANSYKLSTCMYCSTTFKRKETMNDHILKKHPNFAALLTCVIYTCAKCSYKTTLKSMLKQHNMWKHDEISKLNICIQCKATFKNKVIRDDHIIKKHPKLIASVTSKIHKCETCEYKTTLKKSLCQHNKSRHPEMVPSIEFSTCIHCKAIFSTKSALDDHIIKNHPDSITSVTNKIHQCTICDYKTTKRTNIDKHILIHAKKSVS